MKIKNKKTGEVVTVCPIYLQSQGEYNSLTELNEDWEDYEEPKEFWFVDSVGEVQDTTYVTDYDKTNLRNFGNYFETEEEAKKAVEKLKAWKRLRDEGAEFYGRRRNQTGTYELYMRWEDRIPRSYEVKKDLDLLFGGEE